MPELFDFDQVLDVLANHRVTVKPATMEISVQGGDKLPVQARLSLRADQDIRKVVIQYICALDTGKIRELEDCEDRVYQAVVPEREPVEELEPA